MEFKSVVKNRYSCKKYSERQVEKEKLEAILEAGRLAPSGTYCKKSSGAENLCNSV